MKNPTRCTKHGIRYESGDSCPKCKSIIDKWNDVSKNTFKVEPLIEVWVVTKYIDETEAGIIWELQGVFSTEEKALAACRDHNYGLGPQKLDETLPHNHVEWKGFYYPTGEKQNG